MTDNVYDSWILKRVKNKEKLRRRGGVPSGGISHKSMRVKRKVELMVLRRGQLIRKATPAEKAMETILKESKLKYRFQAPFFTHKSFYIVDYLVKGYKLIIEVDGLSHSYPKQQQYDEKRELFLARGGYTTLRFTNTSIITEAEYVLFRLLKYKQEYEERILTKYRKKAMMSPNAWRLSKWYATPQQIY